MKWEVEYTDEFEEWWLTLTETEQEDISASVYLLEQRGPSLGFPHSSGINGSKHSHCANLERSIAVDHTGACTRLIREELLFY